MMLVISRRRRSPRMEEFGRTTMTDVINDKEMKAKMCDRKDEVKLRRRGRRETRRRWPDEMDDERGDRLGDEVDESEVEEGEGEEGEIGDRREDWQRRRVIDGEIGVWLLSLFSFLCRYFSPLMKMLGWFSYDNIQWKKI